MIEIFGIPYLKKGSGIYIKKKNRGKFREYCGGEVTNECIQKAKKSKNPTLRKRATFAQNVRGWAKKHSGGGETYTKEQEAVRRALTSKEPASNYSDAVDMNIWKPREVVTDWVQRLGNLFGTHARTGLSNCTLTASQWVNPKRPIGRAASIVTDPEKHQFSQIPEEYAIPGTLVIASKDPAQYKDGVDNVYHTMLLTGFADKDYDFSYGGKDYKIKKGEPLVDYSRGQNMASELRRSIPLSVYNDQGEGKTFNRFYKPKDDKITQIMMPEIVITPKK